jgi:hypothetical protein
LDLAGDVTASSNEVLDVPQVGVRRFCRALLIALGPRDPVCGLEQTRTSYRTRRSGPCSPTSRAPGPSGSGPPRNGQTSHLDRRSAPATGRYGARFEGIDSWQPKPTSSQSRGSGMGARDMLRSGSVTVPDRSGRGRAFRQRTLPVQLSNGSLPFSKIDVIRSVRADRAVNRRGVPAAIGVECV